MTITALRILPPFAIGRLGSASEPMDNYTIEDDPENPLGFRKIKPAETLIVDAESGEISESRTPTKITFKQNGCIRPVAPFLEVFAVTDKNMLEPLTLEMLSRHGLSVECISWQVRVANRKVFRRTGDKNDVVKAKFDLNFAKAKPAAFHQPHRLEGRCNNFIKRKPEPFIDFGRVHFVRPNHKFPEIRLRFTPAKGLIYGPKQPADWDKLYPSGSPQEYPIPKERRIYRADGDWVGFRGEEVKYWEDTVPPSLFAIRPPAPSWLNDNIAISLGYLDDACDGFVEVTLKWPGRAQKTLTARARISAGPPSPVADALFVRSLADDLDQAINGPVVPSKEADETTRTRALDIVRRAYETVRFMNVEVMNGNNFKGRNALDLDSMPEEEAADTERAIRPVMSAGTVDTRAIMALHAQVYAALQGGAAPWFVRLLRHPNDVADFTDRGRRKMPALMCGADNGYLALTHRQIDTLRKAAEGPSPQAKAAGATPPSEKLTPRNLSAQLHYEAAGNPINSRPVTAVANCCPGLEVDFRAVWRRIFKGIVLREHDNLVVGIDDKDPDLTGRKKRELRRLVKHRLLRVRLRHDPAIRFTTQIKGPAPSDFPTGEILLTTQDNPNGLAALEWSNALATVLSKYQGETVMCDFTEEESEEHQECSDEPKNYRSLRFEVRHFFEAGTAVISKELAKPGELTQGLCSPWQNDYRECSCYYWASARPDFVNVQTASNGLSAGDNWFQKERTGDYVADDYSDTRLVLYDELFLRWEHWIRFQVDGKDVPEENKE